MRTSLLTEIAPENSIAKRLDREVPKSERVFIAVAFVTRGGARQLFSGLRPLLEAGKPVELHTSGYMGNTEAEALRDLLKMAGEYSSLTLRFSARERFHAKFILLQQHSERYCLYAGSSNISRAGLAGLGEINVEILGSRGDSVWQSVRIVIDNLRKDVDFRPLDTDAIEEYESEWRGKRKKRRTGRRQAPPSNLPPLQRMPVLVVKDEFTEDEMEKIRSVHPQWRDYVDVTPGLRTLKRGQSFFYIDVVDRAKKRCAGAKFLTYDKVRGVGMIAHVRVGRKTPLKRMAAKMGVSQEELLEKTYLDVYGIAIARNVIRQSWS